MATMQNPEGAVDEVLVRPYVETDAAATLEIFVRAILEGARSRYSDEQVRAWLGEAPRAPGWNADWMATRTFVAVSDEVVVGFVDLREDGYVDRLFTLPSRSRGGVGSALIRHVLAVARSESIPRLMTHASHLARPVFERFGFVVDHAETVRRGGIGLERFAMHLDVG